MPIVRQFQLTVQAELFNVQSSLRLALYLCGPHCRVAVMQGSQPSLGKGKGDSFF